jgi:hypothetical protein
MKQLDTGSEDAALWNKRYKELYNEDKKGDRDELLSEAKFGSWLRSLEAPSILGNMVARIGPS